MRLVVMEGRVLIVYCGECAHCFLKGVWLLSIERGGLLPIEEGLFMVECGERFNCGLRMAGLMLTDGSMVIID